MTDHRVRPRTTVTLARIDPDDTGDFDIHKDGKAQAQCCTRDLLSRLACLQERLYANGKQSLLIVLQGMDTAGKDGTIKRVMTGVNPQGCRIVAFKVPSTRERGHDFLWRIHQEVPPQGQIGLFNRSHYEDVLTTRVHGLVSDKLAAQRFLHITHFERLLHDSGTTILKFFLYISKDQQRKRLLDRIRNPEKRWKFHPHDLEDRKLWNDYVKVYEEAIEATSTSYAPWHIVPANRKWYRDFVIATTIVDALERMKLSTPPPPSGIDFDHLTIP